MDALHPLLRALHLGQKRSLVALVRGRPWQLADLAQALLEVDPDLIALPRVSELAQAPEGSLVLAGMDDAGARWLNLFRNGIGWRNLRLVLFDSQGLALRALAPDLDSWVGTRVELPDALPEWTLRVMREAHQGRVFWGGGDLKAACAQAWPGRPVVEVPGYAALREGLASLADPGNIVHFTDLRSPWELRRVIWAMASAERAGGVVLSGELAPPLGFALAHALPMGWEQASEALKQQPRGALIAALLGLEPEAVRRLEGAQEVLGLEQALERARAAPEVVESGDEEASWRVWELEVLEKRPDEMPGRGLPLETITDPRLSSLVTAALRWPDLLPKIYLAQLSAVLWSNDPEAMEHLWTRTASWNEGLENFTKVAQSLIDTRQPHLAAFLLQSLEKLDAKESAPETLQKIRILRAMSLAETGATGAARRSLRTVLRKQRHEAGPEHPATLRTMSALGALEVEFGDIDKGVKLLDQALQGQVKVLPVDHFQTLNTMTALALGLARQGRFSSALAIQQRHLESMKRARGEENRGTLTSMFHLARLMRHAGDLSGAEGMLGTLTTAAEKVQVPWLRATVRCEQALLQNSRGIPPTPEVLAELDVTSEEEARSQAPSPFRSSWLEYQTWRKSHPA